MSDQPSAKSRSAAPLRSIADIAIVAVYIVVVPPLLETTMANVGYGTTGVTRIVATGGIFLGLVALVAVLSALRGESLSDLGLRAPQSISRTTVLGIAIAALIFAALNELQRAGVMGETRLGDMASELKGDLLLTLARILLSITVVGFTEELLFRGFVLDRVERAFGGGHLALAAAIPTQAALFGLSHAYQGLEGILFTGGVGFVFGVAYVAVGRNLWPVIIAHGVFDAARAAYLYHLLTNTGTPT